MTTKIPPINSIKRIVELKKSLNEYQRRRLYASFALDYGLSAFKVSEIFNTNIKTVYKGLKELKEGYKPDKGKVRRSGGGRKKKLEQQPELLEKFEEKLEDYKAGLPQDESKYWLSITSKEITELLNANGWKISEYHVKIFLGVLKYSKRSWLKKLAYKEVEYRDEQFRFINKLKKKFIALGAPVLSIDTKKKEPIGNYKRDGQVFCQNAPHALDHDYFWDGKIVPHGIYDLAMNIGYLTIGLSHDTSEFLCDCLFRIWMEKLQYIYRDTDTIVLLCDGGGSNASSHHIVKQDLMDLATRLGKKILVVHYPPYCSKWNPIEHRFFPYVTKVWKDYPLKSVKEAAQRAAKAKTSKGLTTHVTINTNIYTTKRKLRPDYEKRVRRQIAFREVGDELSKLCYLIKPEVA